MKIGIIATLVIILILELCRSFRILKRHSKDIEELKERVVNIEDSVKK